MHAELIKNINNIGNIKKKKEKKQQLIDLITDLKYKNKVYIYFV